MNRQPHFLFIFILALIAVVSIHSAAIEPAEAAATPDIHVPSVSEAILLAIENSPDIKTSQLQLEEAGIGFRTLYAGLLGFRVDAHINDQLALDQRTKLYNGNDAVNTFSATVSVRKALALGARSAITLAEQRVPLEQAERAMIRQVADVIVTTFDAYRQLELALMRYELSVTAQNLAEQGARVAKDRLKHGAITPADAEESQLQLIEAMNETRYAENILDVVWINLAQMIGINPNDVSIRDVPVRSLEQSMQLIQKDGGPFSPPTPHPWSNESAEDMVAQAMQKRSELDDAKSFVDLADTAIKKASLDKRPSFELKASYTTTDHLTAALSVDNEWVLTGSATKAYLSDVPTPTAQDPTAQDPTDDWEVGFGVTFNLWDSGVVKQSIERGNKAKERANLGLSQAQQGIELDVLSAHADLLKSYDSLHLARERTLLAEARFNIEKDKLQLGTSTELIVDQAAIKKWGSVIQAVADRFQYESALLTLARAKGMDAESLFELADHLQRW